MKAAYLLFAAIVPFVMAQEQPVDEAATPTPEDGDFEVASTLYGGYNGYNLGYGYGNAYPNGAGAWYGHDYGFGQGFGYGYGNEFAYDAYPQPCYKKPRQSVYRQKTVVRGYPATNQGYNYGYGYGF